MSLHPELPEAQKLAGDWLEANGSIWLRGYPLNCVATFNGEDAVKNAKRCEVEHTATTGISSEALENGIIDELLHLVGLAAIQANTSERFQEQTQKLLKMLEGCVV